MPWGVAAAVIAAGGAVYAADASKDAAAGQAGAAGQATDVQERMFNQTMANQQPFMQSGYGALSELNRLMGIAPQTALGNAPGTLENEEAQYWGQGNGGRLIGDTYLPPDVQLQDEGRGWYRVTLPDGTYLGNLRPGGRNGRFENIGSRIPTPGDYAGTGSSPDSSGYRVNPNGSISRVLGNAIEGSANSPGSGVQSPSGTNPPGALPTSGSTGLQTGYLTQTFGPQQFMQNIDPGYGWRLQQGAQGVMNNAAAASGALSGPALRALMDYNQGAASQEYGAAFDRFQTQQGNIFQRLSSIVNLGQNAAAGVGQQGTAVGGQIGANIIGAGNAAAAGQVGAANAISNAASTLGSLAYMYGTRPPSTGTT